MPRHEVCKHCDQYQSLVAPQYRDQQPTFWYCHGACVVQIEDARTPTLYRGEAGARPCPYVFEHIVAGDPNGAT
jgi:hypothetical protein